MITNRKVRKAYDQGYQRGVNGDKPTGLNWGRPEDSYDIRMMAMEAGHLDGYQKWQYVTERRHIELHGDPLPPPEVNLRPSA